MRLKRIKIENVRSFLEPQEVLFDGPISIIVGPNGGGKTNLLDTIVAIFRGHLIRPRFLTQVQRDVGIRWQLNDNTGSIINLEKHSHALDKPQSVEVELQISQTDIDGMKSIKSEAKSLIANSKKILENDPWSVCEQWNPDQIQPGTSFIYRWNGHQLDQNQDDNARQFREYLQLFEIDNRLRSEVGTTSLQMPMMYLPVNRTASNILSSVRLSEYNDIDQIRNFSSTNSRSPANLMYLSIGRISRKYRHLLEKSNISAKTEFDNDPQIKSLTANLKSLGYEWELTTVNVDTNEYDVLLKKQGTVFLASAASSGERELLTYLFAIYGLNVRDALILVDEPELHLHPKWQTALFDLFKKLSEETGNQFVMTTHSPSFITPSSIQYVSRVYSERQRSRSIRLNSTSLPNPKHLFNAVNSQNNERIFFADHVVLVEGISDKMVFEKLLDIKGRSEVIKGGITIEIVSVGGKNLFPAYQKLLSACGVNCSVVADLDYLEEIGDNSIKSLFRLDVDGVKKSLTSDANSIDAKTLVDAIDIAMQNGNWSESQRIWNYIKSRRIKLIDQIDGNDKDSLNLFIENMRNSNIYVLKLGDIEDYLPDGFKGKDIEKLIQLVNQEDFWDVLPFQGRAELEEIANSLLGRVS